MEAGQAARDEARVDGRAAEQLLKLIESLEELDDVQKVDANFDMDIPEVAQA